MSLYRVAVREVHVQQVKVEAESSQEAIRKVTSGEGEWLDGECEYSHTLPMDLWTVEDWIPDSPENLRSKLLERVITQTLIDVLIPRHNYTSCSDDSLANWGNARCDRCALMHARKEGNWSELTYDFQVHSVEQY